MAHAWGGRRQRRHVDAELDLGQDYAVAQLPSGCAAAVGPWRQGRLKVQEVLRCRYSNSDQLGDLLGQLLHDPRWSVV